jgi:hypothetical protein
MPAARARGPASSIFPGGHNLFGNFFSRWSRALLKLPLPLHPPHQGAFVEIITRGWRRIDAEILAQGDVRRRRRLRIQIALDAALEDAD